MTPVPVAPVPNTPGIFGYVAAVGVACGLAGALTYLATQLVDLGDDESGSLLITVTAAIIYVPLLALVLGIYGFPVAVAGVLLVHLALRGVAHQAAHVAAAGLVGVALSVLYLRVTDFVDGGPSSGVIAVAVGIGAAAGRAAVLPLVSSRRRLAEQGRLTGTARW